MVAVDDNDPSSYKTIEARMRAKDKQLRIMLNDLWVPTSTPARECCEVNCTNWTGLDGDGLCSFHRIDEKEIDE